MDLRVTHLVHGSRGRLIVAVEAQGVAGLDQQLIVHGLVREVLEPRVPVLVAVGRCVEFSVSLLMLSGLSESLAIARPSSWHCWQIGALARSRHHVAEVAAAESDLDSMRPRSCRSPRACVTFM